MDIVIHDLTEEDWEKISGQYSGTRVISNNETIKKCVGCFGCWVKTPGQCVLPDEYQQMGEWISKADKVTIISKCSFGCYSSFVKNVMDRSISYILPYFEIRNGEMHHKSRYQKDLEINVIFYGEAITEAEKKTAEELVAANAINFHGKVGNVTFTTKKELCQTEECQRELHSPANRINSGCDTNNCNEKSGEAHKVILMNCSFRGERSNSNYFLQKLEENLNIPYEHLHLSKMQDMTICFEKLAGAEALVLGMPLYVDSTPAQVVEWLEQIYEKRKETWKALKVYVISNLGFYDSKQIHIQLAIVKNWCDKMNFTYGGGLAIGAGEMLGGLGAVPINQGPNKILGKGLAKMAEAVNQNMTVENIFVEPSGFPRWMYMLAAGSTWAPQARKNGVSRREIRRKM